MLTAVGRVSVNASQKREHCSMRCVDSRDILSGENLKIALKVCLGDEEGTALLRMCLVVVYGDEKISIFFR